MCALLPLQGENLCYIHLKFSYQTKRRALIDKRSCANVLREPLFIELNFTIPQFFTLEKSSFNSVTNNTKCDGRSDPAFVSIRLPIAPATVPVGLTAVPAPLPPPAVTAAPALLVAPDPVDVAAEPQTPERPQLPTQDVR